MRDSVKTMHEGQLLKVPQSRRNLSLGASKSFEKIDTAQTITDKGSRRHSLDKRCNGTAINKVSTAIFKADTGSRGGGRSMFVSGRQSRWDDARRLQLCSDSNHTARMDDNDTNENITGTDQAQRINFSDQSQSPKVDFKTLVSMFLKRSSIYALNQVGNSATTRRKVFWALIMIIGILGSGIQIIQYLKAYFKYPVVVNMDSIYSLDQDFPAVTVCNLNRVRKEFLPCLKQKLNHISCNISGVDAEDVPVSFTNDTDCPIFSANNMSMSSLYRYMWQNLYASQEKESQIAFGHQGEDFIRSCSFNGEVCTLDNFTQTLDLEYGNCYTFNAANESTPALKTPFVGPNAGLELELDLEVDKYGAYTRAVGARVQVHDPYHEQNTQLQGINVSPGFESSVTLSKFMMLRLPKPYKDRCKEYPTGESKDTCNEACWNDMLVKRCGCSPFGKKERHCDLTKMSDICCYYSPSEGVCDCPLSCNYTFYQFNIFSALWPSYSHFEANPTNSTVTGQVLTYDDIRESRLTLKVYYDTLETVVYQQKPMYQSSEVFSQIGGQMGLWLGLSLVAIFECVENVVLLWKYRSMNLSQIKPAS